jgi:hypothetical protein
MTPVLNPVALVTALLPGQPSAPVPPLAVHDSALVVDQVMRTALPGVTLDGVSVS